MIFFETLLVLLWGPLRFPARVVMQTQALQRPLFSRRERLIDADSIFFNHLTSTSRQRKSAEVRSREASVSTQSALTNLQLRTYCVL